MGTPQDPTEAGGPPAPSHPHAFGGKSAEGTPPSLCPHGEAQYGAGWVLGQGMMLGPACRELVLGTNTGCWAPIPGAGHLYWVQGTNTGCCYRLQGAGATLGTACETLGAGAEHWVLGACGGCWYWDHGAG